MAALVGRDPRPEREAEPVATSLISTLPAGCREILSLKYVEGLTVAAIADRLNLRIHQVDHLLEKGRDLLRWRLGGGRTTRP